ncbi:MAG: pyridoxamine 5'-phosphate oxidase family protein, partial [Planctomycetota bacterium]
MMCSFKGPANILRFYGTVEVVQPGEPRFDELIGLFPDMPGVRQIMIIHVETLQTSCGYGVPQYEMVAERQTLVK